MVLAMRCRMRSMSALDDRVSFAELETLENFDGLLRYELYEGEVIALPGAYVKHELVVSELMGIFIDYRRIHGGVVFGSYAKVALSEHNVFLPDISWFSKGRMQLIADEGPISVVPDLVVEVISRSTGVRDRGRKRDTFARYGLAEYWLAQPASKTLEIYAQNDGTLDLVGYYSGQDEVISPTVPDLRFTVDMIFGDPRSR
jgi:Uma2 family endonuclease